MKNLVIVGLAAALVVAQDDLPVNGNMTVQGILKSAGANSKIDFSLSTNTRALQEVVSDPSGTCTGGEIINKLTGVVWACVFPSSGAVSGTWQATSTTFSAQVANRVFAGPSSGAAAAPGFRALTLADLPTCPTATAGSVLYRWNGTTIICGGVAGEDVTSGVVAAARGGAGAVAGLMKANGSGTVSAAVAGTDYQVPVTLTTTGTSGPATFSAGTLNIPNYATGGGSTLPCAVTVAANVATIAECRWRVGDIPFSAPGATATVASALASGTLRIWANSSGLVVGHDLTTVTCSGCTIAPATTGFPAGVVPIASVAVASGGALGVVTDHRRELAVAGLVASPTIGLSRDLSTGATQPFLLSDPVPSFSTAGAGYLLAAPLESASVGGQDTFNSTTAAPYYVQFRLTASMTVRKVRMFISSIATSASAGLAFGIYDSACARIAQTTAVVPNGATGATTLNFVQPLVLPPGIYHIGYGSETTLGNFTQVSLSSAVTQMLNESSLARVFTGSIGTTGTGAGLTMPASCGTRTAVGTFPIYALLVP
jgi:hypothetical protein